MNLLFFPNPVRHIHAIKHICKVLNIKTVNHGPFDAVIVWGRNNIIKLKEFSDKGYPVINQFVNSSKRHVDSVHDKIFGYKTFVDPLIYTGSMVVKSNGNGKHDGKIIKGPITSDQLNKNKVYQIKIDTLKNGYYLEYRTSIVDRKPVFLFVKYKKRPKDIFGTTKGLNKIAWGQPKDFFTAEQIDLITKYCEESKIDFADIDILIDTTTEKLYIIDVNPGSSTAHFLFWKPYQEYKKEHIFTEMGPNKLKAFREYVNSVYIPVCKNYFDSFKNKS